MQSSAELHGKDRMRKALISSNAINNINIDKWSIVFSCKNLLQVTSFLI